MLSATQMHGKMQSSGTWFSGGIDSVRLMFGLDDLEGLLQPK